MLLWKAVGMMGCDTGEEWEEEEWEDADFEEGEP